MLYLSQSRFNTFPIHSQTDFGGKVGTWVRCDTLETFVYPPILWVYSGSKLVLFFSFHRTNCDRQTRGCIRSEFPLKEESGMLIVTRPYQAIQGTFYLLMCVHSESYC
jgi:hypothetical protein